ncbi:MAG: hypothetical protein E6R04_06930 [Spirochaetes bacterium]|nr:MAG: hypothetical protein E6R04_06930 [Spirochaetota bacterium]
MNLTNERLKEIAESYPRLGLTETEWKSIAAELLRWRETRAMRDVGDEEIRELNHNLLKRGCPSVWVCRLRDIAIARGRTRTDAVNKAAEWAKECGRLDEEVERLKSKLEHKSQQVDAQVSLVSEMQAKIDYLTEENERLHDEAQVTDSLVLTLQEEVKTLTKERGEAQKDLEKQVDITYEAKAVVSQMQKELTALKSSPGIEEVDALENEYLFTLKTLGHLGSLADRYSLRDLAVKLASLARQAIASRDEEKKRADSCRTNMFQAEQERDEMAGLLKWVATSKVDGLSVMATLMAKSHYGNTDARRILEIVEGK